MAWGPDANTEEELEKLAAVRAYLERVFPGAEIRNSYNADLLAQVFRIDADQKGESLDAIVLTEFLDEQPADGLGKMLASWRLAEHLKTARKVTVTSWGLEE